MLNDADLALIRLEFVDKNPNEGGTHWEDCHLQHQSCAVAKLLEDIQELRGAIFDNCSVTVKGETMIQEWARNLLFPQ
jgi:hypothetical protein